MSPNFDLLRILYSKTKSKKQKKLFTDKIKLEIETDNFVKDAAQLALIFLIKTQGFEKTLKYYFNQFSPSIKQYDLLQTIHKYLIFEYAKLEEKDLDLLEANLESNKSAVAEKVKATEKQNYGSFYLEGQKTLYRILNDISDVRYDRLSTELFENINFEINQDKEILQNNFDTLGFDKNLGKSLDHIEQQFLISNNEFDYKTCADHLRTFTAAFIKEVAITVSNINGESLNNRKPHRYLKDIKFFHGSKEADFLQAFQNYLSASSVHKLNSEKEVVRTAKNIAIEFALLLSQRLEQYKVERASRPH
ncbi:MAG: hypothetical protein IIB40_10090 [Candidatus Marinimicrobia bacterium]|nr:hypothetical protein [Candidatus Neomarinimicrobiota bacterium]